MMMTTRAGGRFFDFAHPSALFRTSSIPPHLRLLAAPSTAIFGNNNNNFVRRYSVVVRPGGLVSVSPSNPQAIHETRQRVTLIPGDGIGPEVMEQCKRVLRVMALPLGYDEFNFSYMRPAEFNDCRDAILNSIRRNGIRSFSRTGGFACTI